LTARLAASGIDGEEAVTLLDRAPLDIRVNTLRGTDRYVISLPITGKQLPAVCGLRFPYGTPVDQWPAYADGLIEVQDCGSQLVSEAVAALSGETVIDLCAGAGGKTLALAAAMRGEGALVACDTDRGRLSRLGPRAERAGARFIQTVLLDPGREAETLSPWTRQADAVLIDAPCSGTGTWRRNPEARWRLSEEALGELTTLQGRLLEVAAPLVQSGGLLVYAVCSLLDEEGPDQIDRFLAAHPEWRAISPLAQEIGRPRGPGLRLTPFHDETDGFFIARLEKP
jgi:16S rRNA (cytosine967-C5)-methyltransferase